MINGVQYIESFVKQPEELFQDLMKDVVWDTSMRSRKTASFGVAYNYSQINYPEVPLLPYLDVVCMAIQDTLGFRPNNCLINLYNDGNSKMGFHSDQTDILAQGTGVVIISLGAERVLQFRALLNRERKIDYKLSSGSLLYMDQETQALWQHAIPRDETVDPRMSLTFRKIKSEE